MSEKTEVLATPSETGDRYQIRLTIRPGKGPGVRGSGVHTHPGLTEEFRCISGAGKVRLGRAVSDLNPGDEVVVGPGTAHGLKNTEDEPLVLDTDLVFTAPGPRPEADLMMIGTVIAGLVQDGKASRWTGYPPLLQMAVIQDAHPEAMQPTGLTRFLVPVLAALGRIRGYRSRYPEYE
ncbi:MAG: cupin domain-containing protein [Acidimicrobiia bacterium]